LTFDGEEFDYPIDKYMIASVEELHLYPNYYHPLSTMLPPGLKKLTLSLDDHSQKILASDIPKSITHLTLNDLDQSLDGIFHYGITHLQIGFKSNQRIFKGQLPGSLVSLRILHAFNQDITDCIPDGVQYLQLGHRFNNSIDNLPASVTDVVLGNMFDQSVDNLSHGVTHLTFGSNFNQSVDKLLSSITHISFDYQFNRNIDALPDSITHLTFYGCFNQAIRAFPPRLKYLKLKQYFNQPLRLLPRTLKHLELGTDFNQPINDMVHRIPFGVEYLEFGSHFNKPIKDAFPMKGYHGIRNYIPPTVTNLIFGWQFNQDISETIPASVTHLKFGYDFCIDIANAITKHHLAEFKRRVVDCIPASVTHLKFDSRISFGAQKLFPLTIRSLIVDSYETRSKSQDNPWNRNHDRY
jgi:hypothetical protein